MKTAFLVLCFLLSGCDQFKSNALESTQPQRSPHFQLAVDATGNAWRWDTVTGETWKCWQGTPGVARPTCYPMFLGQ